MEDEEAPQTVRLYAFAAQDAEAREEELDRNGENEQPGKYDERPCALHPSDQSPQVVSRSVCCLATASDRSTKHARGLPSVLV